MPARTTLAPRRLPVRFTVFFRFPEHKIQRIFFQITGHFDTSVSCFQIIYVLMGKFSVIFELSGTVIYGSIRCRICISFLDQCTDHIQHTLDFLRSQRMCSCRFYIHIVHIFFALFDVLLGHLLGCTALFHGFFDDLVIHIRKVRHIIYFVSFVFHISAHSVKYNHRTGISNMDKVIYGRSAYIHTYFSFM